MVTGVEKDHTTPRQFSFGGLRVEKRVLTSFPHFEQMLQDRTGSQRLPDRRQNGLNVQSIFGTVLNLYYNPQRLSSPPIVRHVFVVWTSVHPLSLYVILYILGLLFVPSLKIPLIL